MIPCFVVDSFTGNGGRERDQSLGGWLAHASFCKLLLQYAWDRGEGGGLHCLFVCL